MNDKARVDLAVFPESAEARDLLKHFPETADLLFLTGIPKDCLGGQYSVAEKLTLDVMPPRGQLIRFGNLFDSSDGLFIDPHTGEVIEIFRGKVNCLVNSSLGQFKRTVIQVVERYPFYTLDAENDVNNEEIAAVVNELNAIIDGIDPLARAVDCFWTTFVGDVSVGDYANKDEVDKERLRGREVS